MDKKEINEIRKLMTKDSCRIDKIRGCFVNENGEIITQLKETFHAMPEDLSQKYLELFRRTLTGKTGRNLFTMEYAPEEEAQGGRQEFLYRLLRSELEDRELVLEFFRMIIGNVMIPSRYLLVLGYGAYDIPAKTSDGIEMEDASDYVYQFLVCSICPVTEVKDGLFFDSDLGSFIDKKGELGVQVPSCGFLFPTFHDRLPDIHELLYYARKEDDQHQELIDGLVGRLLPATESVQQDIFMDVVEKTLGRSCDFESVMALTESVNEMIRESKDDPEPLELGRTQVRRLIKESTDDKTVLDHFDEVFDETVGEDTVLMAENVGGGSTIRIKSPSVSISVKADMSSMITSRVIDGREYLLIPVQDEIELNGIRILPKYQGNHPENTQEDPEAPF